MRSSDSARWTTVQPWHPISSTRAPSGRLDSTVDSDPDSARIAVDRAFIAAVRGEDQDIRVPYAEAVRTHALALAVAESAATGKAVSLA